MFFSTTLANIPELQFEPLSLSSWSVLASVWVSRMAAAWAPALDLVSTAFLGYL
jgi:hypothetical protein